MIQLLTTIRDDFESRDVDFLRGHLQRSLQNLAQRIQMPPSTRSAAPATRRHARQTRTARRHR